MSKVFKPERLREVRSLDDVLEFLADDLDWPVEAVDLEEATFEYTPEELGVPADRVPRLRSMNQLRPLTTHQPWGVFFLEFDGPRLPLTPLRRLLQSLVTKKRAAASGQHRTWSLDDLLFIVMTDSGDTVELHVLAFFDIDDAIPEIRSLPWRPEQSPVQHLNRLASELLPHLAWPGDVNDESAWRSEWREAFKLRHGEAISTAAALAERMASVAVVLRDKILDALESEGRSGPFHTLLAEVRTELVGDVDEERFADMCAQTLVYGTLSSRVTDPLTFGASPTLSAVPLANPFLAAFFEQVHDQVTEIDLDAAGLEQLVADLKASNVEHILDNFGSTIRGGDPVVHFYEEFLKQYDSQMRADAGAFYTPQSVVRFIIRTVDDVLRTRLGLRAGIADGSTWAEVAEANGLPIPDDADPDAPFISMLDPATGTGTFLVEWIRQARRSHAAAPNGRSWSEHFEQVVLPSMHGFELMLAPYAIAHLKLALETHADDVTANSGTVLLTDTLERPALEGRFALMDDPVAAEGERANEVKDHSAITVCVGNPPYNRVAKDAGSGWITKPRGGRKSLFDDILDPARQHTIFSHHASLYNLYVYFWRWSLWKVFEQQPDRPGVISFITASSWLTGPGFLGLRQLVRELADEVWVVDLGGDNKGARPEENVFDIQTPVAIVTIYSSGKTDRTVPAEVHYRRTSGTRAEKLASLDAFETDPSDWTDAPNAWRASFIPTAGGADWESYPALTDLFPWQQPGCKFGRTWPIAPEASVLEERWKRFVSTADAEDRAECFVTPRSGRNVHTKVSGFSRLVDLPVGAESEQMERYAYRSFDRQWTFADPRLAKTESPSLWACATDRQIFMVSKPTMGLGDGPAAVATTSVPDLHMFRGSFGGKDVIPLFRDGSDTPNFSPGWLTAVRDIMASTSDGRRPLKPEHVFTYSYALLAGTDYTTRFADELKTPGPRVPLTRDPSLFDEAVDFGEHLLWLQTFGERFTDGRGTSVVPKDSEIRWSRLITRPPATIKEVRYESAHRRLFIADGVLDGVSPEAWSFEVSGLQVIKKWLGYRTSKGTGRAASSKSPLDHIRPATWPDAWSDELVELVSVLAQTIDLIPQGTALLARICEGPLIRSGELPPIPPELRQPPPVSRREQGTLGG